ncbi:MULTISPECIES: hypothetical protein [Prochlorococcus]|uniref:Uncharacterized protein n=1 Tax=Prochlorococcus marinus str. MIT 9116 TaxID=167544 RepID=A0A0A1ZSA2_PROMR|nr:hypothetical protein [Prochlorococcus marinus]KGF89396.1 hypothetical protein EU92_1953 [Prochlorococcus marinus str. MIT 9107]KGF91114.1 hypothetical protein EU93_1283 [Prochlorococcus marinus str. MIT 9116]
MPTKLDRVQVLFKKDLFNKLRLLARIERRSLSSMVGSIVEDAIKSNKYQSLLSKAKANDLKSEIMESKSVINEILQSEISNELDFDANSKLKKLDAILSLISESKKESLEEPLEEPLEEDLIVKDLLVEDALKPHGLIDEIQSNTDYKINKMNEMLQKIQQKNEV